ncbi:U6 snrna phosphodiesterase [Thalictrum thalictroides]|uniref:U6 snRNA phosphodiesterase 1 n=1 Tax=Thalictrum thalictroides TaxID=46969 RepID=A0A7J6WHX3_THATH|nr:U6 snrna phosphodiesterase [Thalictrum thalictroides]
MSTGPSGAYAQPQRQHTQSLTTGLLEEMSKIRFEIGRVASAMESKIRMDDPLWDRCADAIEAMTELDDEAKLMVMEILVDGMEMRKMFIRLKDSQRRSWILRKIGRTVHIPSTPRKELARLFKRIAGVVPDLHVVDADIPLNVLCKDDQKLEQVGLGREFHISLGRTVPIRVHQIESIVTMLRQRLQPQKGYWIDFNKLEVFVNDDHTRTFLSLEGTSRGLAEITKQIQSVNEIYRLHNLPEFYKDPRPHISLAWAVGDISHLLRQQVEEEKRRYCSNGGSVQKLNFTCKFSGIECRRRRQPPYIAKIVEFYESIVDEHYLIAQCFYTPVGTSSTIVFRSPKSKNTSSFVKLLTSGQRLQLSNKSRSEVGNNCIPWQVCKTATEEF